MSVLFSISMISSLCLFLSLFVVNGLTSSLMDDELDRDATVNIGEESNCAVRRRRSNPGGHTDGLVVFACSSDASEGQSS